MLLAVRAGSAGTAGPSGESTEGLRLGRCIQRAIGEVLREELGRGDTGPLEQAVERRPSGLGLNNKNHLGANSSGSVPGLLRVETY